METELKSNSVSESVMIARIFCGKRGLSVRNHIKAWVSNNIRIKSCLDFLVQNFILRLPIFREVPLAL